MCFKIWASPNNHFRQRIHIPDRHAYIRGKPSCTSRIYHFPIRHTDQYLNIPSTFATEMYSNPASPSSPCRMEVEGTAGDSLSANFEQILNDRSSTNLRSLISSADYPNSFGEENTIFDAQFLPLAMSSPSMRASSGIDQNTVFPQYDNRLAFIMFLLLSFIAKYIGLGFRSRNSVSPHRASFIWTIPMG